MFEVNIGHELEKLTARQNPIKKTVKILIDDPTYLSIITKFKTSEITTDFILLDYEKCLNRNDYLKKHYNKILSQFWMIAETGQGDEWFISIDNKLVYFYDHNLGEYTEENFTTLDVVFVDFLKLNFLIKELEDLIEKDFDKDTLKEKFIKSVNEIEGGLYEKYPYKYF